MVLRALSDLILPPRCAACDAWGATPLCSACDRAISWIGRDSCVRCGAPARKPQPTCKLCAHDDLAFARAACVAVYEGPVREAIVAYKLAGERRAAETFGRWLTLAAARLRKPDAITWVPSTRKTLSARGFDPAASIAQAFAVQVGMRAEPRLRKIRETSDQHGLTREQRHENLAGAFAAWETHGVVLLVDDILTTGSTADACARALLATGAAEVEVLAVARAI